MRWITLHRGTMKPGPVAGSQALTRDAERKLKLYQSFCYIVGGVLSPLLANIALHGLERSIRTTFPQRYGRNARSAPTVVRYADDFVVLHPDRSVIEQIQQHIATWLQGMGLELKPSKTRIAHTLNPHNGQVGFDFLGFLVRQFPVGKTHSGTYVDRAQQTHLLGFKTIIRPNRTAVKRHSLALRAIIHQHKMAPQAALIDRLNPVIRGWTRYYATVCSKATFATLEHLTFLKLRRWAKRRHPRKPWYWVARKYWRLDQGHWHFAVKDGIWLYRHTQMPIRRHIKVQGVRSPYDGDWAYWARRLGKHPDMPMSITKLLQRQHGKCAWCGLSFHEEDVLERDHVIPIALGGRNQYANWQLLHRHCHDQKTASDGSLAVRHARCLSEHRRDARGGGTHDKRQTNEEPDVGKLTRPVLQTSQLGD